MATKTKKASAAGVCGESYDHDLMELDSRDGITVYECRTCGAEIVEDEDEDASGDLLLESRPFHMD